MRPGKKFYQHVDARPHDSGWGIFLDNRIVRTPGRQELVVPTSGLAEAIATEWRAQEQDIIPASMPVTQLAMTALDRIAAHRSDIVATLSEYIDHDVLCFREDHPAAWADFQSIHWDSILNVLRDMHGLDLLLNNGITVMPQSAKTHEFFHNWLTGLDDWQLSSVQVLIPALGSPGLCYALLAGNITSDQALFAAFLEEHWQQQNWGQDPDAAKRRQRIQSEIDNCLMFLMLLQGEQPRQMNALS